MSAISRPAPLYTPAQFRCLRKSLRLFGIFVCVNLCDLAMATIITKFNRHIEHMNRQYYGKSSERNVITWCLTLQIIVHSYRRTVAVSHEDFVPSAHEGIAVAVGVEVAPTQIVHRFGVAGARSQASFGSAQTIVQRLAPAASLMMDVPANTNLFGYHQYWQRR